MSASSKTMNGALPPSSIEQDITDLAAWPSSSRPTSVEPVNESLRTRESFSIASTAGPGLDVVTTLTTPSGTPASLQQRGQRERGQRGVLGRLEHHRAPGRQGRADLAGGHRGREVPRGDQQADPDRLVQGEDLVGAGRRAHQGALDPHRLLGVPAEELGRVGRLAARVAQRLAVLGRHQPRELLGPGGHQLERLAQDLRPLPGRGRGPAGQRVVGRADRVERVRRRCRRRPRRWAPRWRGRAPGTSRPLAPLAPDEQAGRNVDAGEFGDAHVLLHAFSVWVIRAIEPTLRPGDQLDGVGRGRASRRAGSAAECAWPAR